jgi:hypothetical protein
MAKEGRLSICEFTTFPASFADALRAYSAAGAAGIGVCEAKRGPGDEERLLESGLGATTCVPVVPAEETARRAREGFEHAWAQAHAHA